VLETELWSGLRHRRVAKAAGQPKSPLLRPPRQRPTLQRRNVLGHLPEEHQPFIEQKLVAAWSMFGYEQARKALEEVRLELERINPSAARSLAEGLEETLTLQRLGCPEKLRKTLF
jgi:hypothetical protein